MPVYRMTINLKHKGLHGFSIKADFTNKAKYGEDASRAEHYIAHPEQRLCILSGLCDGYQ